MRRTYQDLVRAAGVHDAVTRAISGHATPAMQLHYSTARGDEVRSALAQVAGIATAGKVIDLATARRARKQAAWFAPLADGAALTLGVTALPARQPCWSRGRWARADANKLRLLVALVDAPAILLRDLHEERLRGASR